MEEMYYVLFNSHEQAVQLHMQLSGAGFHAEIAPTPRSVSRCCGVSLMILKEEIDSVRKYLKDKNCTYRSVERVVQNFDPHRDHYI